MNAPRPVKRRARRQWTAFGILFAISVVLMGTSGTSAASDVESGFNYAMQPPVIWLNQTADTLGSYWSAFTQIDRLRTENDQLRQENEKLQEELARMPPTPAPTMHGKKTPRARRWRFYASPQAIVVPRRSSSSRC